MKFTPILIVYCILLLITAIAVKELNKCTNILERYKIKIQEHK